MQGRIQGGAHPARPLPPPKIGKNMIFWRKIVIFHTKYPKNFRASLRSAPPQTSNTGSAPEMYIIYPRYNGYQRILFIRGAIVVVLAW